MDVQHHQPMTPATPVTPATPASAVAHSSSGCSMVDRCDECCSICQSPLFAPAGTCGSAGGGCCDASGDREVTRLRCNHAFHRGCINKSVEFGHRNCPLCRAALPPGFTPEATRRFRERSLDSRAAEMDARRRGEVGVMSHYFANSASNAGRVNIPERARAARLAVLRSNVNLFDTVGGIPHGFGAAAIPAPS